MTFLYVDMYGVLAREHQRELIEAAAERRMLRLAREAHPSRRRLGAEAARAAAVRRVSQGWRLPTHPPCFGSCQNADWRLPSLALNGA